MVVTVVVLLVARRWWLALTVAVVGALAPLITNLIKPVVDRAAPRVGRAVRDDRPARVPVGARHGRHRGVDACAASPSAACCEPALGAVVALPFILLGFAIGLSRLVLGVHWPSDVVAGWAVAVCVTCIAGALFIARSERTVLR